ncbi:zinc-dependent alcohol dehydrogenase [Vibrio methylphosphonaticus]|uniref:zinc-dependent alcohol dehydrogenase n=1 Tax=Vibrio methylphosphonaticus TaxID=2946866 RepID=UPI002029CDC6|nr:zinc-binding dehydrogenase [Vibrio methylphosphonaticus]MCL9775651.1 zinc-binding dehydrogenase [Vibrio methylphosphonaticus]
MRDTYNVKLVGLKDVQLLNEQLDDSNLKSNEAIIKNEMSLISAGTELSRVYGIKKGVEYPLYTGYISVGEVVEKGDDLSGIEVGDRVMFNGPHKQFQRFEHNGRNLELILKVDPELTLEQAALVYLASISMNGVAIADIKLGDTAAVFGLGTIGLITAKLLQLAGAKVIAIDPVASRTEDAKKIGIQHVVSCAPEHQESEVMALTNGRGVDIAIDVAGVSPAIETAVNCAAFNGQVILSGSPRAEHQGNVTAILNRIHMRMLTVKGAYNGLYPFYEQEGSRMCVERNMQYIVDCLKDGRLKAEDYISHILSPRDAMQGYQGLMEDRDNYKCVAFDWTQL